MLIRIQFARVKALSLLLKSQGAPALSPIHGLRSGRVYLSEANVTVTPDATTTYFLSVFDGTLTFDNQITIQVNPLPVVYIGADTAICAGDNIVLSAGEGFASYLWSTGDTTSSIETAVQGSYSVMVTNEFNCSGIDTIYLTVNPLPVVNIGADTAICAGEIITLYAGEGFASLPLEYRCYNIIDRNSRTGFIFG